MPPRNKRCHNCPQPVIKPVPPTTINLVLSSEGEGKRIWEHVETATALCIGMMEGYMQFGLSGASREALLALRTRLDSLIDSLT
jgi:hypothetical protein